MAKAKQAPAVRFWKDQWQEMVNGVRAMGGDGEGPHIAPPASEAEVLAVEEELGQPIPAALRSVLREYSASVRVEWTLPETLLEERVQPGLPDEFRDIFGGRLGWDLREFAELQSSLASWIEGCFPDPHNPYDAVWHGKFAFWNVPNGDLLALDHDGAVVYLSHDDGEGHGLVLGRDFRDYVDRATQLGFPGPEDWQWLPFHGAEGLAPDSPSALRWREWLGFRPPAAKAPPPESCNWHIDELRTSLEGHGWALVAEAVLEGRLYPYRWQLARGGGSQELELYFQLDRRRNEASRTVAVRHMESRSDCVFLRDRKGDRSKARAELQRFVEKVMAWVQDAAGGA